MGQRERSQRRGRNDEDYQSGSYKFIWVVLITIINIIINKLRHNQKVTLNTRRNVSCAARNSAGPGPKVWMSKKKRFHLDKSDQKLWNEKRVSQETGTFGSMYLRFMCNSFFQETLLIDVSAPPNFLQVLQINFHFLRSQTNWTINTLMSLTLNIFS